ncbi:GNAT family N-acetyltransferase [Rhodococcus chondri]|uniref:GNAT family N-acetyltransferase n=1 Tax=Rhodococcus chondri TaxID=3065941 RepID=A0ABU7JM27_9NOCA|nr:GNAT family N-acetyltransferase [Rhodococcus sp. CC-R104]MEE2030524.1 GNAT family N-acetyltransferase [Rhodococcus sp. CC-R104]
MSDSPVTVVHNADKQRYELRDDDAVIGYTQYHPDGDTQLVFDHTEVDDGYSGQGLAGKLVRFALDDVRERGKRVVAICPYVDNFIGKHPEYQDLTD